MGENCLICGASVVNESGEFGGHDGLLPRMFATQDGRAEWVEAYCHRCGAEINNALHDYKDATENRARLKELATAWWERSAITLEEYGFLKRVSTLL